MQHYEFKKGRTLNEKKQETRFCISLIQATRFEKKRVQIVC